MAEEFKAYSVEIPDMGAFLLLTEGEDARIISGGIEAIEYLIECLGQPVTRLRRIDNDSSPARSPWVRYDKAERCPSSFELFDKYADEPIVHRAQTPHPETGEAPLKLGEEGEDNGTD